MKSVGKGGRIVIVSFPVASSEMEHDGLIKNSESYSYRIVRDVLYRHL